MSKIFKKLLATILSLLTLSSLSILCCGAEEITKKSEVDSITSNVKETKKEDQEIRNEKIKKFLDEKGKYFPEKKLMEINSILHSLENDDLEIALNIDFKKPSYITLAAALGGVFGVDSFTLGSNIRGSLRLLLSGVSACAVAGFKHFFNLLNSNYCAKYEKSTDIFTVAVIATVPVSIITWALNVAAASSRAKNYNYQLLLNKISKNKTNLQIIK